jgi:hypothetical protein
MKGDGEFNIPIPPFRLDSFLQLEAGTLFAVLTARSRSVRKKAGLAETPWPFQSAIRGRKFIGELMREV